MSYIGKTPTSVPLTSSDITDSIISLPKLTNGTDGNLISYDASGNPVAIATGSDGQVLTSTGAGSPPVFETLPSSAKVLQIINSTTGYAQSTTGTSATDVLSASGTTWETAITPSATNSKILVIASVCSFNAQNGSDTTQENRYFLNFFQKIGSGSYGSILNQTYIGDYYYNGTQQTDLSPKWQSFTKLITTNTTSACSYKFQYALHSSGGKVEVNNSDKISSITLMEISA